MGVNKFTACSVFRLVLIGKERHLAAMLAGCSCVWQSESRKPEIKKGTVARTGPGQRQTLVGELCSAGRSSREGFTGSVSLMNAQLVTYHRTTE